LRQGPAYRCAHAGYTMSHADPIARRRANQIADLAIFRLSSPFRKNILLFRTPDHPYIPAIPSHTKGAFRDRHERWSGMRWTRAVLARNRIAGRLARAVSGNGRADEGTSRVQPSRVVLTPRRRRQVFAEVARARPGGRNQYPQGDGDKKARFTGESSKQLLRPLRAERRVVSVYLW